LAWLTAASVVQQVSAFVLSVLLRSLLGPARTGIWNLVEVWRQQLSAVTLGVGQAADRDMPVLRAQGRSDEEAAVRSVTFSFTLGEAAAVALAFWVYWAIARENLDASLALGFALVPVMASLTSLVSVYQLFLKNQKRFRVFALLGIAQLVIDWSALAFVLIGGLDALLIGLAIGWVARMALYWGVVRRLGLWRIHLGVRWALLKPMLALGLPLSLWSLAYQLILRVDSLVVGTALGTTALGFYFLGPQVAAALAALPTSISVISYPNLMESYGRGGREALAPHLERYLRVMALVASPLMAAGGVFGMAILVRGFLADFTPGLDAMQVFCLTLLFMQSGYVLTQVLVATRRVRMLIGLTVGALAVEAAVLGLLALLGGLSIVDAAWGAVAGQAAMTIVLLVACARLLGLARADLVEFWGRVPAAWALLTGLILGLDALGDVPSGLLDAVAQFAWQMAAFGVVGFVIVWLLDRAVVRETRALLRAGG